MLCFLVATHSDTGSILGHLRSPYRLVGATAGLRWSGERAVKALRAKGNGIRKVAAELGIGVSTVERIDAGG
jgi:hypothetical protein